MKTVSIEEGIAGKFGSIKIGFLFVDNINVIKTPPREKKIARAVESEIRMNFNSESIENDHNVSEWLKLAQEMGIKDEMLLPAHIGALKSILGGRDIPKINSVVDAANIVAAKYRCPVGIFDADMIDSNITLRLAIEGEKYVPLFSKIEVPVNKGEIVYADDIGIFSRYSKDADRTKVTDNTISLFCVVDGASGISPSHILEARDTLQDLLKDISNPGLEVSSGFIEAV